MISVSQDLIFSDEDNASPELDDSVESWRKPKQTKSQAPKERARDNQRDEDMEELSDGNGQEEEQFPIYYGDDIDQYMNRDSVEQPH